MINCSWNKQKTLEFLPLDNSPYPTKGTKDKATKVVNNFNLNHQIQVFN